jgi:transcriptional pleiotropic regulator of transition state genes
MKSVGIIRNLDELGRIVIPIEIRKSLNIKEKDAIEISTDHDSIILKKKENTCVFCNSVYNLEEFNSKYICTNCKNNLKES